MWDEDPVMLPFKRGGARRAVPGLCRAADRKAAEGLSKYIIIDMYAKAVQGMSAEDAVKWAHGEVKKHLRRLRRTVT